MSDETTASAQIIHYYLDQDERLLHLLGQILQELHRSGQRNLKLEIAVMTQMIDCYESLGRFDEADTVKMALVVVKIDHGIKTGTIDLTRIHEQAAA